MAKTIPKKEDDFHNDAKRAEEKLLAVEVKSTKLSDTEEDTGEKIIVYGETGSGKSYFYMSIPEYYKKLGIKPKDFRMCIINTDRQSGVNKLIPFVPKEYRDRIEVFTCDTFEEIYKATMESKDILIKHFEDTKQKGWLAVELLNESWEAAQDYYSRLAYGEFLGEYFAKRRVDVLARAEKPEKATAYAALDGWGDWPVIKYFHNHLWIDKIKRFPFNVVFTAEAKAETTAGSIFSKVGKMPAGEKENIHRVDEVVYMLKDDYQFFQRTLKLTGYTRIYPEIDVTDKNAYEVHKNELKRLESLGYKVGKFAEADQEVKKQEKDKKEDKEDKKQEAKKEEPKEKEVLEKPQVDEGFTLKLE